jgi:hypothetical protein
VTDDPRRGDRDPASQAADALRARLRAMQPAEMVELCAELLTTYVVEGVLPLGRAAESTDLAADAAGEETFAQMLKRLKAARKDPVLDRFIIDGENISVRIEGQGILPITEYRRPTAAPLPAGTPAAPRREGAPGATSSVYNRALYQAEQPPRTPAQAPSPAPGPTPQQPAAKKEEPKDRFTLIELE